MAEVVEEYFAGDLRADSQLFTYAERINNRTVFKRLGYLLETLRIEAPDLLDACLRQRSSGITALDPTARTRGVITRRWNLRVNASVVPRDRPA